MVIVSPISEEGDGDVERRNADHAQVHDSEEAGEALGRLHFLVDGQHQGDAFISEEDGAEEEREPGPRPERRHRVDGRKVLEHVNEHDDHGEDQEEVAGERDGRQPFQIPNPVQEYQRDRYDDHVNPGVERRPGEMIHKLQSKFQIGSSAINNQFKQHHHQ